MLTLDRGDAGIVMMGAIAIISACMMKRRAELLSSIVGLFRPNIARVDAVLTISAA